MVMEYRMLGEADRPLLERIEDEALFDKPVERELITSFLTDPRHHMAAALDGGRIVGFASGVHYLHPDKAPELWINEVGVLETHQKRGIGKTLVGMLIEHGRSLGCVEAWVLTDDDNEAARALYRSAGGQETTGVVMVSFKLQ